MIYTPQTPTPVAEDDWITLIKKGRIRRTTIEELTNFMAIALPGGGGGGVTDHGLLTGLADDDHTQYHTDARGDARYSLLAHNHTGLYDAIGAAAAAQAAAIAASTPIAHVGSGGVSHANVVAAGAAGFMSGGDKTKLDGIATGATVNSADATLLARANHTGTQPASTVSDFSEAVDDRVAALLVAGTNMTLTYNDGAGTLTLDATGGGGSGLTQQQVSTIASLRI